MRCPSLTDLPESPPGKSGWPWTERSACVSERTAERQTWPRITVVTPSFNHGQFIEETIRSILLQGYPNLEYFVLDGGSTDNSVEIIRRYSPWIDFWVSEPDGGQSAAINRGLKMGTGLHATWINSDDMLYKDALYNQVLSRELVGDVVYIGDCVNIDAGGTVLFNHRGRILSLEDLLRVPSVWRSKRYICQQEVLFPLELALRVGGLNERNHYSMDYELWGRLLLAGAKVEYTGIPFGFFRWHAGQKTQDNIKQTESMLDAAETLLAEATFMPEETKDDILAELRTYRAEYPVRAWKTSGRLTRLGLPSAIVVPIRHLRHAVEKRIGSFMRSTK